ncbi:MAG: CT583 family protein [Chlamydiales bacterium]|nr:CT583 family protein [Chlamydiales bacterium]
MAKITSILQQRFRKKEKPKMSELAEKTAGGQLTVFSGIFGLGKLGEKEQEELSSLLRKFSYDENADLSEDLKQLIAITSEVKAINNQAAILHGERIKIAQTILKNYRDGAFTAWLTATYGNRQTPYNFLQYYEFYSKIPKTLHPQVESMPRQAVYTLASRDGSFSKKEEIVRNYKGETKQQMISLIRSLFPLDESDRRREDVGESALKTLQRLVLTFESSQVKMSQKQKRSMHELLGLLGSLVDICEVK